MFNLPSNPFDKVSQDSRQTKRRPALASEKNLNIERRWGPGSRDIISTDFDANSLVFSGEHK